MTGSVRGDLITEYKISPDFRSFLQVGASSGAPLPLQSFFIFWLLYAFGSDRAFDWRRRSAQVAGDTNIVTQGEEGDVFYILEEGSAIALKDNTQVLRRPKPPLNCLLSKN